MHAYCNYNVVHFFYITRIKLSFLRCLTNFVLVPIANNAIINVWVQGEKIEGQWLFDDGTPIPNFCRISTSNGPKEVHLRAHGSASFSCIDAPNSDPYHYSCEYHRLLSIRN